jgi:hypothetical protein
MFQILRVELHGQYIQSIIEGRTSWSIFLMIPVWRVELHNSHYLYFICWRWNSFDIPKFPILRMELCDSTFPMLPYWRWNSIWSIRLSTSPILRVELHISRLWVELHGPHSYVSNIGVGSVFCKVPYNWLNVELHGQQSFSKFHTNYLLRVGKIQIFRFPIPMT